MTPLSRRGPAPAEHTGTPCCNCRKGAPMTHRILVGTVAAFMLCVAAPRVAHAQTTPTDTVTIAPVMRPLEAVVVTGKRQSGFASAMSKLGLRASIATKQ